MLLNFNKVFVCFLLISILSISSIFAIEDTKSQSTTTKNTKSAPAENLSADTKINTTEKTSNPAIPSNPSSVNSNKATNTTNTNTDNSSGNIANNLLNSITARRAPITSISEISNAIDNDYSFLYDPDMKPDLIKDMSDNPDNYVIIYLETGDAVLIKLRSDIAPNTVLRFKELVKENYYDDMEIFRAIPDYLVQMGDPSGSGYGGKGVFYFAEIDPDEKFKRGTVAMSNNGNLQSDDTQFFITFNSFDWLNGKYTIFGEVVLGMNKLENVNKSLINDGFVTNPSIITKVELLSDRPSDRIDDLSTFLSPDKKVQAIKKQEENIKKEKEKQTAMIKNEAQQEIIKKSLEKTHTTPNKDISHNTSSENNDSPIDEQSQGNNSNPYIK